MRSLTRAYPVFDCCIATILHYFIYRKASRTNLISGIPSTASILCICHEIRRSGRDAHDLPMCGRFHVWIVELLHKRDEAYSFVLQEFGLHKAFCFRYKGIDKISVLSGVPVLRPTPRQPNPVIHILWLTVNSCSLVRECSWIGINVRRSHRFCKTNTPRCYPTRSLIFVSPHVSKLDLEKIPPMMASVCSPWPWILHRQPRNHD
jgi:hypothetical protein